jgi:Tfp pilus assembly protein PilP
VQADARRINVRITAGTVAVALLGLAGCSEESSSVPSNQDFAKARSELVAKMGKNKPVKPRKVAPAADKAVEQSFSGMGGFQYDPSGKRDPFRSFEWEQLRREISDAGSRSPLEQFDVMQLDVVGVVWNAQNARALIQDPSGMSYIVGEGARVGKNEGRVTRIDDNLVVVKETYVDFMGEETTKDIEMRIRSTEGG